MNFYRIWYVKGARGAKLVRADTVNGFNPDSDTYVFKIGSEVVAVIPKARVVTVEKTGTYEDDE